MLTNTIMLLFWFQFSPVVLMIDVMNATKFHTLLIAPRGKLPLFISTSCSGIIQLCLFTSLWDKDICTSK